MSEFLSHLWSILSAWNILEIAAAALVVSTVLEKIFDVEFVGRRIFKLLNRVLMFFLNWFCMPIKPHFEEVRDLLFSARKIDEKLSGLIATTEERDVKRTELLSKFGTSLAKIEQEVTLNGGGSIKDAVTRLVKHDRGTWDIMVELRESSRLTNLRLDIMDEADRRMSFRLSPAGDCTEISPVFLRFFGYTDEDLLGSDWEFCISKRSLQSVQDGWTKAIAKRQPYRNEQYIVDSDGKEYLCLVRGYPLIANRDLQGFYGTVEVIEELAHAQG